MIEVESNDEVPGKVEVQSDLPIAPTIVDANQGAVHAAKDRLLLVNREKASDRKAHIVDEIQNVPETSRLCDQFEGTKEKIQVSEDCGLYVEQEGEGEPIVLLHGGPGATHHYFHPHFSQLKDSARVISYDQRGCGLSDRVAGDGYSIDQAVDDLENLRIKLGIDRWTLLGHSYGGILAQSYAKKYPQSVKGLVLTCASPGLKTLQPGRGDAFLSEEESERIGDVHSKSGLPEQDAVYNAFLNGDWKRQNLYKPTKEEMARFALYEWDHDPNFRSAVAPEADSCDFEGLFEGFPIPTMIMEGAQDMTWNTDKPGKFHANHPNADMVICKNAAHNPFQDEPGKFFGELRAFLEGLPQEVPSDLSSWEKHISDWEVAKSNSPDNFITSLSDDEAAYEKIVEAYSPEWLGQLRYSSSFREVGFSLYIANRYEEALRFFEKMEGAATFGPPEIAVALIWQAHMLDLLGRRGEAVALYGRVVEMDVNDEISHDQFGGLSYKPSAYAQERVDEPFVRVELV